MNITTIDEDPKLKLTWDAPEGNTLPDGYNILIDGVLVKDNVRGLTITDNASVWNVYDGQTHYVEVVAIYPNSKRSVSAIGVVSDVLNVNEIEANKCNIYPNPANDRLYIEAEAEIIEVSVYDVYGRTQNLRISESQNLRISINVSELNAGIYFVKINTENGEIVKRFIKE